MTLITTLIPAYKPEHLGDTLDSLVTESGIQTDLRSATFPTSLHYFHRTEEQTSHLNDANFAITQDTFEWLSTWRPTTSQQLTWDYTLDNVTETGDLRPNNTFLRQHAIGTHELNFGDNDEHQLRSTFFGYNESGEIDMSRLRLDEAPEPICTAASPLPGESIPSMKPKSLYNTTSSRFI